MNLNSTQWRTDLLGRGFTLVETPWFFDENTLARVQRRRTTLPVDGKRWWKFPQLAHYACWLEDLLVEALPNEPVHLACLDYRHEPTGAVDEQVDGLHADGGYIRSVFTHFGLPTIYREARVEHSVPDSQTLVMTAQDRTRALRIPCTLHRRPGAGPERAVIVCTFAPGQYPGPGQAVHRRVAEPSP